MAATNTWFDTVMRRPQSPTCNRAKDQGNTHLAVRKKKHTHTLRLALNPPGHESTVHATHLLQVLLTELTCQACFFLPPPTGYIH